jgi:hypothetical protein
LPPLQKPKVISLPMNGPRVKRLQDYLQECHTLDAESFRQRHGHAFLIHRSDSAVVRKRDGKRLTVSSMTVRDASGIPMVPEPDLVVFPVRHGTHKEPGEFISVGRYAGNDVVIPYEPVTRIHALFTRDQAGRFFLLDAGSKNGTFVNDLPVPLRGKGEPAEVKSGAQIRLGPLSFTFLTADQFYEFAGSQP